MQLLTVRAYVTTSIGTSGLVISSRSVIFLNVNCLSKAIIVCCSVPTAMQLEIIVPHVIEMFHEPFTDRKMAHIRP